MHYYSTLALVFVWEALSSRLTPNVAYATPIKQSKRQAIQDEYDFIICGGATFIEATC